LKPIMFEEGKKERPPNFNSYSSKPSHSTILSHHH
jgi:hypothetical protein